MSWFDYVDTVGIVGALAVGADQVRRSVKDARQRDVDRQTERALELYRDLVVDGETALAFNRLSVLLRRLGAEKYGTTTWLLLSDAEFDLGRLLDPTQARLDTPFQDLYQVLWYFERVETAIHYTLVDEDVLFRTLGFHCWWWAELLRNVEGPKAVRALQALGPAALAWADAEGEAARWLSHCQTDFDGAGPREGPRPEPDAGGDYLASAEESLEETDESL